MKTLILGVAVAACVACSGRPTEAPSSPSAIPTSDGGDLARSEAVPASSSPMPGALDQRLDIPLALNKPVLIEPLGVTVTLVRAERLRVRDPVRGWAHVDESVIRFERPGEAAFEMPFGRDRDNFILFGHGFAVFVGTELSVFPPGAAIEP